MRSRLAYNDNDLIMSLRIIHTKYMNFEFGIVIMGKGVDQDYSVIYLEFFVYQQIHQMFSPICFTNFFHKLFSV